MNETSLDNIYFIYNILNSNEISIKSFKCNQVLTYEIGDLIQCTNSKNIKDKPVSYKVTRIDRQTVIDYDNIFCKINIYCEEYKIADETFKVKIISSPINHTVWYSNQIGNMFLVQDNYEYPGHVYVVSIEDGRVQRDSRLICKGDIVISHD